MFKEFEVYRHESKSSKQTWSTGKGAEVGKGKKEYLESPS
jgi:hypothetical protein